MKAKYMNPHTGSVALLQVVKCGDGEWRDWDNVKAELGCVDWNDVEYGLIDVAFIDNDSFDLTKAIYKSRAINRDFELFEIIWDTLPLTYDEDGEIEEREAEDDCDWKRPRSIRNERGELV